MILKTATQVIQFLIRNSSFKIPFAWIQWRETVLAIYETELQTGVIDAEINAGKSIAKKINSLNSLKSTLSEASDETRTEILSLLELYKIILESSMNFTPGTFNNSIYNEIKELITADKTLQQNASTQAEKWYHFKEENKFYTEIFVPASIKPILLDFILRTIVLWIFQNWVWKQFNISDAEAFFWIIQIIIIPASIITYAFIRDKKIIRSTQSLIKQIKIEKIKIRIKNTSWHYLLLFMMILIGSTITLSISKLGIDLIGMLFISIGYGLYILILQTNFSKQSPSYTSIKQQIEDKENMELSGELTPDQNDEEIVNLEVNLKAENERMNAYVIEAALFGALAFSGYLQLVSDGGMSIATVTDFNHHLMRVVGHFIDTPVKNISESYMFLISRSGILALISYQLLLCSIFFLAVIASRLRFSKLTDYIDRFLQLSKAMNEKEENLILNDKNNTEAIGLYNRKIKDLLQKGYKKQYEIVPIMEYMQFFRTLGVVMFFVIIITGGLFISTWISVILFFISLLSLFYFHLGKFRNQLKLFYIKMQEFYYTANKTINWICWGMILLALILRSFAITGGDIMMIVGFTLLFLHYLLNLFIPVQFDYEIKNTDDAFGSAITYHKILSYVFKVSLAIFFLSYMLKANRLYGAGALLTISLFMLSVFFLLVPKFKSGSSWMEYVLGAGISSALLAILFKTQHWPMGGLIWMASYVLIPTSGIIIFLRYKNIRPLIIRTVIILFVLVLGSFSKYVRLAITSLNFNYEVYEQREKEIKARSILMLGDNNMVSSKAIGVDSLKRTIATFNSIFVHTDHPDYNFLNDRAWEVYLYSNDSLLLHNALLWSELTVKDDEKEWYWIDTYAALLFKNRKYHEARIYAKEAFQLGNDESTKQLIHQIDSALVAEGEEIKE